MTHLFVSPENSAREIWLFVASCLNSTGDGEATARLRARHSNNKHVEQIWG